MKTKISGFIFLSILLIALGTIMLHADDPSDWSADYVTRAIEMNLIPLSLRSDYSDPITHAEFAALVVAAYENRRGNIVPRLPFINSPNMDVQKAATIGVIDGFRHNMMIDLSYLTREDAALMLSRLAYALNHPLSSSSPTFVDNHSISPQAFEAIGQIQAANIMGGVHYNFFLPTAQMTREQSIITIIRLMDLIPIPPIAEPAVTIEMAISAFEREIFTLTNAERLNYNLPPLIWSYDLAHAARLHSRDMAQNNFIDHTGSDGSTIRERLTHAGLTSTGWGENITGGVNNAHEAITAWMDAPGNRMIILSPHMTHLGVGFYYSTESEFVFYTTQKFVRDLGHL